MRISYWSSDVCSSDLKLRGHGRGQGNPVYCSSEIAAGLELPAAARTNTILSRCMSSGSDMLPRMSAMRVLGWRMMGRVAEGRTSGGGGRGVAVGVDIGCHGSIKKKRMRKTSQE